LQGKFAPFSSENTPVGPWWRPLLLPPSYERCVVSIKAFWPAIGRPFIPPSSPFSLRLLLSSLLLGSLTLGTVQAQKAPHTFALGTSQFLLDGQPLQMISGELHYPRIPREAWRSRLKMAKAMGLNTIGTYVFWNVHEPQPGKYDFAGNNDVAAFVKMAQEEGLWVILRPSPYVCAEWEFGGYPYWLQNVPGLKVRSQEPQYIAAYTRYLQAVGKQLAPLQVNHGGPVLMVQVENEYGSYGADKQYLAQNKKLFIDAGFDGLLYTCDPVRDVAAGHLPGLLPAVNGTDKPSQIRQPRWQRPLLRGRVVPGVVRLVGHAAPHRAGRPLHAGPRFGAARRHEHQHVHVSRGHHAGLSERGQL
jgi:hypothetical protein